MVISYSTVTNLVISPSLFAGPFYVITIPILSEPPELTGEEGEDMDSDIPKIYEKVIYYILANHVGSCKMF